MRALTAIVAAVLPVTTGGPLRCPCELAQLVRPVAVVSADKSPCPSCPCHAHEEPDSPEPTDPRPVPGLPPCPHGPGVDLTPPPAASDRAVDDPFGAAAADITHQHSGFEAGASTARFVLADATPSPPPDHLRYCHAFRC